MARELRGLWSIEKVSVEDEPGFCDLLLETGAMDVSKRRLVS